MLLSLQKYNTSDINNKARKVSIFRYFSKNRGVAGVEMSIIAL